MTESNPEAAATAPTSFAAMGVAADLCQALEGMGYHEPLEVQLFAIPPLLEGRSAAIRSRTGTGKTAAFGIPLLQRLDPAAPGPGMLVLAPTRELAGQIAAELGTIGAPRGLRVLAAYGGAPLEPQKRALREGAQVLIGTPGRLLDLQRQRVLDLSRVRLAVLDEADEMLSMGFYEDVVALMDSCENAEQVVILSASLAKDTDALVARYTRGEPARIDCSAEGLSVENIENVFYRIGDDLPKHHYLLHVLALEQPTSAIVFVNTRSDASLVATLMAREGYQAEMISGELPQSERERVMAAIRAGELRFLVATDLAARGIDISQLSHVINYSLSEDPAIYLHRAGRTGRVGRSGVALSLVGGRDSRALSMVEKRFRVQFSERHFPPAAEMVKSRTADHLDALRTAAEAAIADGHLATAEAVLADPQAVQLVAYLLKRHAERTHDEQRAPANRPQRSTDSGRRGRDHGKPRGRPRRR